MAIQWFVQHGGKQYGPLTSANLKKLADEGKIVPTTSVRSGIEGAWVPASRVQGLFATAPAPAAAKPASPTAKPAPALRKAVTQPPVDLGAPPLAPPPAPPMGRAVAGSPPARAKVAPLPKAVPAATSGSGGSGAMTAKILGAVALILGILALATCWLPLLSAGLTSWLALVVGALGLLLGIGAMVLAAMHKGSGLALGIAGSSSSLVGLVLTAILLFNDFSPQPVIVAAAAPIVATPPAPPPAAKVELPPEPVWTDASESIEQGPIKASIASAKIEPVILENSDPTSLKRQKPQPMLKVRVMIENTSTDRIVEFGGWIGGGDLVGEGLGNLLGNEASKALASVTASTVMVDNIGNKYPQTPLISLFGASIGKDNSIRPGKSSVGELVFRPPLPAIEYLRLELSPVAFGGSEPLRFQIPRAMIDGLPPVEAKPTANAAEAPPASDPPDAP
jgi:hypothetical protein